MHGRAADYRRWRDLRLPTPFIILATQNPIEYEGTFPLPEAQLDRFLLRINLGYPSKRDEMLVLERQQVQHPIEDLDAGDQRRRAGRDAAQRSAETVYVDDLIREYIVTLVGETRSHPDVYLGASPRGSLALFRASQARAALAGRDYVLPDDVKSLAVATLSHRMIVNPGRAGKAHGRRDDRRGDSRQRPGSRDACAPPATLG